MKKKINIKKIIIEILSIIIGSMVMAFGVQMFLLPTKLSSGGFSGIATIVYYFFKTPMGVTNLILNIPLFLIAFFKIGKKFFVKSILGTLSLSFFFDFFDKFNQLTDDRFLACIFGGIIVGMGTAIILKANSSTGGSDLIGNLVTEFNNNLRASNVIVIFDSFVVLLNMIVFKEIEIGLYSAITIYLMGVVIDILFEGIYFTKLIFIISNKNDEIALNIGTKIKRGSTGLYGKGMYESKDKLILMCAVTRQDVPRVKRVAQQIDKNAFIIITNSREVFGIGFKN